MTSRHVGGSGGTSLVMLSQSIKHKFCEIQVTGTYQPSLESASHLCSSRDFSGSTSALHN